MYLDNYKHLSQQVAKKIVPKFINMKKSFWDKDIQSYFTIIPLAHCIMFAPKFQCIERLKHTFNYAIIYQCKHDYKTFQIT
jgi:hypothetical protein